jgi:hypothetical protein
LDVLHRLVQLIQLYETTQCQTNGLLVLADEGTEVDVEQLAALDRASGEGGQGQILIEI